MERRALVCALLLLVGCATTKDSYVAPPLPPDPPAPAQVYQPPALIPSGFDAQEDLLTLMASDPVPEISDKDSRKAVATANAQAVIRPRPGDLKRAVVIYEYKPGARYQIYARSDEPVSLVFSEPEVVLRVNPNEFFDILTEIVGEEPHRESHVLITPKANDVSATLMILTTRAIYYLKVESRASDPMIAVRWRHPEAPKPLPTAPHRGLYYTGYDIQVVAGAPEWTPLEVWDTGLRGQTLIKLPPRAEVAEIPLLYVVANDGKKHLTNWAKRGEWYVVPSLLTRAELGMGHTSEVVRVSRGPQYHGVWCPSPHVTCPEVLP